MDLNEPGVDDLIAEQAAETETPDDNQEADSAADEDIGFGEEVDDSAPDLPKRLRAEIKERDRRLAVANRRLAELDKPAAPVEIGPRPTREEFDWDDARYDAAVDDWNTKRFQAEAQNAAPSDNEAEAKQDVERLTTGIASLPFADAEQVVPAAMEALSPQDQFIIASAAKEPGKLIYALGKNPERLTAILEIKNPVKRIAEIARLEMQMTTTRRAPPPPEQIRQGDAQPAQGGDKELARLQKQAETSGDYTAVLAHKRKAREKAA